MPPAYYLSCCCFSLLACYVEAAGGLPKKWNHTAMSDCVDVCSCNTAQVHLTGKNTVAICHDHKGYLCKIRIKAEMQDSWANIMHS